MDDRSSVARADTTEYAQDDHMSVAETALAQGSVPAAEAGFLKDSRFVEEGVGLGKLQMIRQCVDALRKELTEGIDKLPEKKVMPSPKFVDPSKQTAENKDPYFAYKCRSTWFQSVASNLKMLKVLVDIKDEKVKHKVEAFLLFCDQMGQSEIGLAKEMRDKIAEFIEQETKQMRHLSQEERDQRFQEFRATNNLLIEKEKVRRKPEEIQMANETIEAVIAYFERHFSV